MPIIIYVTLAITVIIIVFLITQNKVIVNPKVKRGCIITAVFLGLFGIGNAYSYLSNASSLKFGDYKVVEGKVENFSPASSNPKGIESFEVNGKIFRYSNASLSGGLTHSISNNGVVKNGSVVKIYYKNDAILRFEVKR
jgi:hypothetical protein